MPVTFDDVRAALLPDEPQYAAAAASLGTDALPHLAALVAGDDINLASKATYLASMIDPADTSNAVRTAAEHSEPVVRVAAAGAAGNLGGDAAEPILLTLLDDEDVGIRKVALLSVRATPGPELTAKITELSQDRGVDEVVRTLSEEIIEGG
ncbi:MAG TPA: HEAT repeat domain-containing protein [Streptosporangiaceae bacterium]|nr:HEAT repeat domain-containing protein [Streptosporangiaceae bacterium]